MEIETKILSQSTPRFRSCSFNANTWKVLEAVNMKILGLDFGYGIDMTGMCELEVTGDYKAPVPRNVIYKIKNWQTISLALVKKK